MTRRVFKILRRQEWNDALAVGHFLGSPDDRRDGFIHLSAADQVIGTLHRHFSAERDLIIMAFEADALGVPLKWEASRNGEQFPHLYAALPVALSLWSRAIVRDDLGNLQLSEADLTC